MSFLHLSFCQVSLTKIVSLPEWHLWAWFALDYIKSALVPLLQGTQEFANVWEYTIASQESMNTIQKSIGLQYSTHIPQQESYGELFFYLKEFDLF